MPRKGLTQEYIVQTALELIETFGTHAFSWNKLAQALDVKPASLYNHVQNMDALIHGVGLRIADQIRQAQLDAIQGKRREDAVFSLCLAYRDFTLHHAELYKVVAGMQRNKSACSQDVYARIIEPIWIVLSEFDLKQKTKMHWQRILRAFMQGFFTYEYTGGFQLFPIEREETYRIAVQSAIQAILTAEKEENA